MIADVAFDVPLSRLFSYLVPERWTVVAGQRVLAPLHGATRVGVVVSVRDGDGDRLKALLRVVDLDPLLDAASFDLARWIAADSITSIGSTCLALLPPVLASRPTGRRARRETTRSSAMHEPAAAATTDPGDHPPAVEPDDATDPHAGSGRLSLDGAREADADPVQTLPQLLVGTGREARLLDAIAHAGTSALVLTPDVEAAARWAQRLARIGPVARLDSGVADEARAHAWMLMASRRVRLAVGTRGAMLAPLPRGAVLAVIDEHEAAHRPPGAPRIHARDVVLERARREGLQAFMTSATPSVETWWRAGEGSVHVAAPRAGPWAPVTITDSRGIARREALTPVLARAIRETLADGRRVFLVVSRLSSSLGCDECGAIVRCPDCAIALAYSPSTRVLTCALCGRAEPPAETCATCGGRRLGPFGWGAERVEHAVRRRFGQARIVRYEPDAARGRKGEAQRAAALAAEVIVGTRGALRLFGPGSLGLAGFIAPDQVLGLPDFRAAERTFGLLWAAAERVRADGQLIVQSRNPTHYALEAVMKQDLERFYRAELTFRSELGYPPFRRIGIVTLKGKDAATTARAADHVAAALRGVSGLAAYPPVVGRRGRTQRIVVKGGESLPRLLTSVLDGADPGETLRGRGIMDVEVDPVEWPS
jgi:primosomal protein N'